MSGKRFLIDTNIIVDFFKGDQVIKEKLSANEIFIPSIVIGELYFGAYTSSIFTNQRKRLKEIFDFISKYPILEVDKNTSEHYGKIKSQLKLKGYPIPENDIWIAAIVLQHNLTIVTKDKHFNKIEELVIEAW